MSTPISKKDPYRRKRSSSVELSERERQKRRVISVAADSGLDGVRSHGSLAMRHVLQTPFPVNEKRTVIRFVPPSDIKRLSDASSSEFASIAASISRDVLFTVGADSSVSVLNNILVFPVTEVIPCSVSLGLHPSCRRSLGSTRLRLRYVHVYFTVQASRRCRFSVGLYNTRVLKFDRHNNISRLCPPTGSCEQVLSTYRRTSFLDSRYAEIPKYCAGRDKAVIRDFARHSSPFLLVKSLDGKESELIVGGSDPVACPLDWAVVLGHKLFCVEGPSWNEVVCSKTWLTKALDDSLESNVSDRHSQSVKIEKEIESFTEDPRDVHTFRLESGPLYHRHYTKKSISLCFDVGKEFNYASSNASSTLTSAIDGLGHLRLFFALVEDFGDDSAHDKDRVDGPFNDCFTILGGITVVPVWSDLDAPVLPDDDSDSSMCLDVDPPGGDAPGDENDFDTVFSRSGTVGI